MISHTHARVAVRAENTAMMIVLKEISDTGDHVMQIPKGY